MSPQQPRGEVMRHLRAWRTYRALSVVELADRAHVARSTIARAERGGLVAWANIQHVAEVLRVAPHTLLSEPPPAGTGAAAGVEEPPAGGAGVVEAVERWRATVMHLAALAEGFDAESGADRAAVDAATDALVRSWVRLRVALAAATGRAS